jgi:hypothetical protein
MSRSSLVRNPSSQPSISSTPASGDTKPLILALDVGTSLPLQARAYAGDGNLGSSNNGAGLVCDRPENCPELRLRPTTR